jgi:hypothetical protein
MVPLFDPPSNEFDIGILRPVSWLADDVLDRLPEDAWRRSVTSSIADDPPTVAGAAAAWPVEADAPHSRFTSCEAPKDENTRA